MVDNNVKDIFLWAHEHRDELAWMSQNTNHISPKEIINDAIKKAIDSKLYEWYPYSKGLPGLADLILKDLHLENQGIILTSGGTEALYILTRALLHDEDEVIASDPSYLIIHKFIRLSNALPVEIPIYNDGWKLSVDKIQKAITPKTKMILLIDPLNPLGSSYTKEEVKAIAEIAHDYKLKIINDITYRDFADEHYLTAWYYPEGSITVFSVSKNCGLAGMRTGALIASKDLMETMAKYNTNDLSINILGQVAAYAALSRKSEWIGKVKAITRGNQKIIKSAVEKFDGVFLPVYPSQANMFVVDVSGSNVNPVDVQKKMLFEHNVFVRAGNYVSDRFGDRFIRVSFSVPEEHAQRFAHAFDVVMNQLIKKTP